MKSEQYFMFSKQMVWFKLPVKWITNFILKYQSFLHIFGSGEIPSMHTFTSGIRYISYNFYSFLSYIFCFNFEFRNSKYYRYLFRFTSNGIFGPIHYWPIYIYSDDRLLNQCMIIGYLCWKNYGEIHLVVIGEILCVSSCAGAHRVEKNEQLTTRRGTPQEEKLQWMNEWMKVNELCGARYACARVVCAHAKNTHLHKNKTTIVSHTHKPYLYMKTTRMNENNLYY